MGECSQASISEWLECGADRGYGRAEAEGDEESPTRNKDSTPLFPWLQFYPHSGPRRGSTRLTLCGSNFYLRPDSPVPEGTHQVTVGQSPCQLLPQDTSSLRYKLGFALPLLPVRATT